MDEQTVKVLLDIGMGGIALVLYWKQGKFLGRLAAGFEAHAIEDTNRGARLDARLLKLEKRRRR